VHHRYQATLVVTPFQRISFATSGKFATGIDNSGNEFATSVNIRMLHHSMNYKKGTKVTAGTPTSEGTPTSAVVIILGAEGLTTAAQHEQQQKSQ
jgi:hypothetical protein